MWEAHIRRRHGPTSMAVPGLSGPRGQADDKVVDYRYGGGVA